MPRRDMNREFRRDLRTCKEQRSPPRSPPDGQFNRQQRRKASARTYIRWDEKRRGDIRLLPRPACGAESGGGPPCREPTRKLAHARARSELAEKPLTARKSRAYLSPQRGRGVSPAPRCVTCMAEDWRETSRQPCRSCLASAGLAVAGPADYWSAASPTARKAPSWRRARRESVPYPFSLDLNDLRRPVRTPGPPGHRRRPRAAEIGPDFLATFRP